MAASAMIPEMAAGEARAVWPVQAMTTAEVGGTKEQSQWSLRGQCRHRQCLWRPVERMEDKTVLIIPLTLPQEAKLATMLSGFPRPLCRRSCVRGRGVCCCLECVRLVLGSRSSCRLGETLLIVAMGRSGGRGTTALPAGAEEVITVVPVPAWLRRPERERLHFLSIQPSLCLLPLAHLLSLACLPRWG